MKVADKSSEIYAISVLDGRYNSKLMDLAAFTSEAALINYRIRVEAGWLLHLSKLPQINSRLQFSDKLKTACERLFRSPPDEAAIGVKKIEQTTNHDVKAVEYYLLEYFKSLDINDSALSLIHFACTSEDINSLAYAMMLEDCKKHCLLKVMDEVLAKVKALSKDYLGLSMLSRTHGQAASPTTLGKELAVFFHRLKRQRDKLSSVRLEGKMSGAVGNYNAHDAAFADVDWPSVAKDFIENVLLTIRQNPLTTQIDNHDCVSEYCDTLKRFNSILIGFCRDIWTYISLGYFTLKPKAGEVGSSTMPHKVNPIDFENAEGNLGLANSLSGHFSDKLLISRLQRDLTDSTVLRNVGAVIGYSVLSYKSLLLGLSKISANKALITEELEGSWEVLAEAVQTVMRSYGVENAYELLKEHTRAKAVDKDLISVVVNSCDQLDADAKAKLKSLTPVEYVGLAVKLVEDYYDETKRNS